jgi:arginine/lysine/ornithine decarboxylase
MAYKDMFTVLVVDSRIKRFRSLNDAFERILGCLRDRHHLRTDLIGTTHDAVVRLRNDASVGCLLLEWGDKGGDSIDGKRVVEVLEDVGLHIPVFLVVAADDLERHRQGLLVGVVRGLIYPEEDTPDFVAKYINRHFEDYIEALKPPFFGRVIEFTEASNEVWTCPGHNGGMFYRKSPVGHIFYEYLGEPIFRTDLDNSVVELGDLILDRIGHLCDYILFDEAWGGFMKFHPLFAGHYAMGLDGLGPDAPGIVATQSTHKQRAGFSQASQIHLKSRHIAGQPRDVTEQRFNETFLLHASTSPFYPLFSSLDVGAQMMKGRNGYHLWNDATRLAVDMRKTIRTLRHRYEAEAGGPGAPQAWFFDPFVPDVVTVTGSPHTADLHDEPWENVPNAVLLAEQQCWLLRPGARWHGFTHLTDGYVMTDPNKLTLVTPGFDRETGGYLDWGVPAPVLAEFLRERGIVPEKNDLNTILFLITPGIEVSKAGTLIAALDDFKRLFDRNASLREVLPAFVAARPRVYGQERLRDLCLRMHDFYRKGHTSKLQREQFQAEHFPQIALSPQEATRLFTANQIDYVPIDEVSGRVAATLALVYPPGIGIVVPGERWDERAAPMIAYLKLFEESYAHFPGFANEIQGVYPEEDEGGRVRLFTYVIK